MINKYLSKLVKSAELLARGEKSYEDFLTQISVEDEEVKDLILDYAESRRMEYNYNQIFSVTGEVEFLGPLYLQQSHSRDLLETLKTLLK